MIYIIAQWIFIGKIKFHLFKFTFLKIKTVCPIFFFFLLLIFFFFGLVSLISFDLVGGIDVEFPLKLRHLGLIDNSNLGGTLSAKLFNESLVNLQTIEIEFGGTKPKRATHCVLHL